MAHPQLPAISIIDRAPNEVLLEIFLHVAAVDPGHDEHSFPISGPHPLLPVVQVNKRFNAVATPLLVRDWHLRPADESGAKFVLHLLKHPQLRSQVKSLAVDERGFRNRIPKPRAPWERYGSALRERDDWWPQDSFSPAQLEILAKTAEQTYPTLACWVHKAKERSWAGKIRHRSTRAIAALALAWATGLQELDLMVDDRTPEPGSWMLWLVKIAGGVLSPLGIEVLGLPLPDVFAKLRCVSLSDYSLHGRINCLDVAAFFRLPSLRVFKALNIKAAGLRLDEADSAGSRASLQLPTGHLFPNRISCVQELHLRRCRVLGDGLSVLTRSCRRLRVLNLQWEWNGHINSSILDNDSIASAIRLHSTSLEKLLIGGSDQPGGDNVSVDDDDFDLGSLGDCLLLCDKLETLVINAERLYGRKFYHENSSCQPLTEVLPTGLVCFGLRISPKSSGVEVINDKIMGLLRECGPHGRFFKLQKINLIGSSDGVMADEDMIALAKKNGVRLTKHDRLDGMM